MAHTTRYLPSDATRREIEAASASLERATQRRANPAVQDRARAEVAFNEHVRLSPPPGGQQLTLPPPQLGQLGDRVYLLIESPHGQLAISVAPFQDTERGPVVQNTVNGVRRILAEQRAGYLELISNGESQWTVVQATVIVGAAPTGATGPQGPIGETGATGEDGWPGPPGRDGEEGQEGRPGPPGEQGERGPQGEQGPPGRDGEEGQEGRQGWPGPQGETGPQGATGPTGPTGPQGDPGDTTGATGAIERTAGESASKFAGIRDNGSLETARTFLNFVSTSFDNTFSLTQDAGNDEIEVRITTLGSFYAEDGVGAIQTKFISFDSGDGTVANVDDNTGGSGYINVSYDVDRTDSFAWTGVHSFTSSVFTVNMTDDVRISGLGGVSLNAGFAASNTATNDLMVNALSGIGIFAGFDDASVAMSDHDISIGAEAGLALTAGVARVTNVANGIRIEAGAQDITAVTNGTTRLAITSSGELELATDPGEEGQVITSAGSGAPPTWRPLIAPPNHYILRDDFSGGAQGFSVPTYGETGWFRTRNTDAGEELIGIASEAGHPGIVRLTSDSNATSNAQVVMLRGTNIAGGTTGNAVHCDDLQESSWVTRPVLMAARRVYAWGYGIDPNSTSPRPAGTSGAMWFIDTDNGNLIFRVVNSGVNSDATVTTGLSGGEWLSCYLRRVGANWISSVRVDAGTVLTNSVAVGSDSVLWEPFAKIYRVSGGNTGFALDVDLYSVFATPGRG